MANEPRRPERYPQAFYVRVVTTCLDDQVTRSPRFWKRNLLATLVLGMIAGSARGQQDVPPERQVLILARVLSYDDEINSRTGDDVTVAVVAKPGNAGSEAMSAGMLKAFKAIGSIKVQGMPLKVVGVNFTGGGALGSAISGQGIDVLYVCAGLEADLPAIIDTTRKNHVLSIGSREDHITRGLAVGVLAMDGKPTIIVNLGASKAEGAAFSSDLLRLAKVIK